MRWLAPSVILLTCMSSTARADKDSRDRDTGHAPAAPAAQNGQAGRGEHADHPEPADHREGPHGDRGGQGNHEGAGGAEDDDDDEDSGTHADAGKARARRTPEQMGFRREVWGRSEKALEAIVHKGNKRITTEEREVIHSHDRHVMRLLRIRELAQEDKADAVVKRVDAALERIEKRTQTKLEKLNDGVTRGGR